MLYFGGILTSALLILTFVSLLNVFFLHSKTLFNLNVYVGLVIFCFYVAYDTQKIIVKSESGNRDVVIHAAELFFDLLAIFVRLLIILIKNQLEEKNKKSKK